MKNKTIWFAALVFIFFLGFTSVGCASNPASTTIMELEPLHMAGSTWSWSSGDDIITFTFIDEENFKIVYKKLPPASSLAPPVMAFFNAELRMNLAFVSAYNKGMYDKEELELYIESVYLDGVYTFTGIYSMSDQFVTLKPSYGLYLEVASNGEIKLAEEVESFAINIENDSFLLGAVTFIKTE